jgi:hypothetical protein
MMLTQRSQVCKCFINSKTEAYIQEKVGIRSENRIENIKGQSIQLRIGSRIIKWAEHFQ